MDLFNNDVKKDTSKKPYFSEEKPLRKKDIKLVEIKHQYVEILKAEVKEEELVCT